MTKFLLRRILHAAISVCIVVLIVMVMIYSMLDRNQIFASDPQFTKVSNNDKILYKYRNWKDYGYVDYITYGDWLQSLATSGEIDEETRKAASSIGRKAENDSDITAEYVERFTREMEAEGYTVVRLEAIMQTP